MYRTMLKSTIHAATVTAGAGVVGSLVLDPDLMDAADLLVGERVTLVEHDTGRLGEAGVVAGVRGSGEVVHLSATGTTVTVTSVLLIDETGTGAHTPRSVRVDADNRVTADVPDPREPAGYAPADSPDGGGPGGGDPDGGDPDGGGPDGGDPGETPDATRLDALIAPMDHGR